MMMIPSPLQNLNMLFQKLLISSSKHYPVSDLNVLSSFDEEKKIGRATILQLKKPMIYSLLLLKLQSSPEEKRQFTNSLTEIYFVWYLSSTCISCWVCYLEALIEAYSYYCHPVQHLICYWYTFCILFDTKIYWIWCSCFVSFWY